jgi:transposase
MRFIGIDVHRDFCEVCVLDRGSGELQRRRVPTRPDELEAFAGELDREDVVALETSSPATAVARVLEPHAGRVMVIDPRRLVRAGARAKTDRLDARTLARLLAAGVLTEIWTPDEATRALRRLVSRRAAVVRARTRLKNEVHAVLARNLCPRPPVSDAFGKAGRRWLETLELPEEERLTVRGCLRQIDALEADVAELEQALAKRLAGSGEARRLLSVPGVNLVVAAAFLAYVGDIHRFPTPKHLVGYLGLDPRVSQSGNDPARGGRISKQGAAEVRHVLSEAAWRGARVPGPLRGFYERIRVRRGSQIAITATARKLAVLFWHLLSREQDYAFAMPSQVQRKRRALELLAGAPAHHGRPGPNGPCRPAATLRAREREIAVAAEHAYQRMIADWQAKPPSRTGAGAATGERL